MQSSKVLLLENVAAQAAAARNALVGAGYRLVISRFEAEGLKRTKEWQPDIIVLSNAYPKGSLSSFCRLLRVETGRHVKIIVASSLTPDRLFQEDPDLKSTADGFVLRPYSAVKLREVLDRLTGPGKAAGGGEIGIAGRRVLLVDGDSDVLRVLREHLDPQGAVVDTATWAEAAAHCVRRPPQAIILEWPTPEGFDIETLRRMHDGGGGEVKASILLISAAGQDIVRSQSPALLNMASMFFARPVAWSHFVRFLVNLLKRAPAIPEEAARPPEPPPSALPAGGSDMEKRFQEELEAKFLEVEELKRSLKAAREEIDHRRVDGAEFGRLQEENARLNGRLEAARREGEVELGKMRLREADLEVKLSSILRKKSEAERRAQDQLDNFTIRAEEAERSLEEAIGELQMKEEQAVALRHDMERVLVEKEQGEEQLESALAEAQKDRRAIEESREKNLRESREELDAAKAREEEMRSRVEERERERDGLREELDAAKAREEEMRSRVEEGEGERSSLREELDSLKEEAEVLRSKEREIQKELEQLQELRSEETGRERGLADRIVELEEVLGEKDGALDSLEKETAEKEKTLAALGEKVRAGEESVASLEEKLRQSEMAVAGLDEEMSGLRQSWAESETAAADMAAREAKLAREMEDSLGDHEKTRESLAGSQAREDDLRRRVEEGEMEADRLRGEVDFLLKRLEAEEKTTAERGAELERLKAEPSEAWAGRIAEAESILARKEEELGRAEEKIVLTGAFASELEAKISQVEKAAEEAGKREAEQRSAAAVAEERTARVEEEKERLAGELAKAKEEGTRAEGDLGELRESLRSSDEKLEEKERKTASLMGDLEKALAEKGSAGQKLHAALADGEGERKKVAELREEQGRGRERLAALERNLQEERDRLDRERGAREEAEREHRAALEEERARLRERDEKLSEVRAKAAAAEATGKEYERLQRLLQEVTARAQSEVIERSRSESELQERLKASVEEKKFLLRRLEKEVAEAVQREKRLTDLLDNALLGAAQARSAQPERARESLPVIVSAPAPAEQPRMRPLIAAVALLGALAFLAWIVITLRPAPDIPTPREAATAPVSPLPGRAGESSGDTVAAERDVWEQWSRSDVSGGVLFQATLRSAEEIAAEVKAEQRSQGWSDEKTSSELEAMLEPYRFEENIYFYLYLKNLQPGYPAYADGIYAHLTLRDDKGNEAPAFAPPDMEKNRRVYSFTSGELSKSRDELVYEVTVPVAFARSDLGPQPRYIELLAYNIGAASRRVLTWELQ